MRTLLLLSAALLSPAFAQASDLDMTVRSGGAATVTVAPGEPVNYEVIGELSDALNEGLGYFRCDLEFDGAPLTAANSPSISPMLNFARPLGLANPAGYGGTVVGGKLRQVGGAQNTVNNFFAAAPIGAVITGIAKKNSPQTLVTGTLNAPLKVGSYTLALTNVDANLIRQGETGVPFWHCDQAGNGTLSNLTVIVSALSGAPGTLSISAAPTKQVLTLDAGTAHANTRYWMLGTMSGTVPGINVSPGVNLPLNPDAYFGFLFNNPHNTILRGELGVLDANGNGVVAFRLSNNTPPVLAGITLHHAYFLPNASFASEAVPVTLVP